MNCVYVIYIKRACAVFWSDNIFCDLEAATGNGGRLFMGLQIKSYFIQRLLLDDWREIEYLLL